MYIYIYIYIYDACMSRGSFPGVKRPGRNVDHPPPSSAEVKERVELYICPPHLWVLVACSSMNFTFTYVYMCVCIMYICMYVCIYNVYVYMLACV